jgi:thiamine biosynthesis lipoprotein
MTEFRRNEECMGTVFVFHGRTENAEIEQLLDKACEKLHEADRIFSLYKPESPLSQLARGETSVANCPPVVEHVWDLCEQWEQATGGYFKAFTPQHTFDPSGLVKTWAAQTAIDVLLTEGVSDFTLNAGGDVWVGDGVTSAIDWKIGVSKPVTISSPEAGVLAVVNLKGSPYRALATSGSAERGAHIWNPQSSGVAVSELVQVSVLAKDLVTADVWATAAFAEGPRALDRIAKLDDVEAMFVFDDGNIDGTDGFAEVLRASV